ncbi:hypothetical protein [Streptomyces tauricus]|uniref:hypothetical protein n=1 Tax=Streptomyces tauricus TaxID=68274 RepID=UPI0022435C22|nr:hypothetical protein [Streptomyces tauricus]MCW8101750.1 hypothetical protein [Streptomyces tauricus]
MTVVVGVSKKAKKGKKMSDPNLSDSALEARIRASDAYHDAQIAEAEQQSIAATAKLASNPDFQRSGDPQTKQAVNAYVAPATTATKGNTARK